MSQFGSHGDNDEEEHDHSRDEGAGRRGRRGGCAAVDGGRWRLRLTLPDRATSPAAHGVLDGRLAVAVLEHMFAGSMLIVLYMHFLMLMNDGGFGSISSTLRKSRPIGDC